MVAAVHRNFVAFTQNGTTPDFSQIELIPALTELDDQEAPFDETKNESWFGGSITICGLTCFA